MRHTHHFAIDVRDGALIFRIVAVQHLQKPRPLRLPHGIGKKVLHQQRTGVLWIAASQEALLDFIVRAPFQRLLDGKLLLFRITACLALIKESAGSGISLEGALQILPACALALDVAQVQPLRVALQNDLVVFPLVFQGGPAQRESHAAIVGTRKGRAAIGVEYGVLHAFRALFRAILTETTLLLEYGLLEFFPSQGSVLIL